MLPNGITIPSAVLSLAGHSPELDQALAVLASVSHLPREVRVAVQATLDGPASDAVHVARRLRSLLDSVQGSPRRRSGSDSEDGVPPRRQGAHGMSRRKMAAIARKLQAIMAREERIRRRAAEIREGYEGLFRRAEALREVVARRAAVTKVAVHPRPPATKEYRENQKNQPTVAPATT